MNKYYNYRKDIRRIAAWKELEKLGFERMDFKSKKRVQTIGAIIKSKPLIIHPCPGHVYHIYNPDLKVSEYVYPREIVHVVKSLL